MRDRRWMGLVGAVLALGLVTAACGGDKKKETPAESDAITSLDDLKKGHVVGVQSGTTGETFAKDKLESKGVSLRAFPEGPDGYTALEACQVDAVVNDEGTAVAEVASREGLEIVQTIDTGEAYGIAVDPNNAPLLEGVNIALADIISDGTYQEIYDKYEDLVPGGNIAESADTSKAGGELPKVETIKKGFLTVGSDIPYPPFEFEENGELVGLDMDLANEIASRLGLKTEIIDTAFDTIFSDLAAGRFDIVVAASTITPEREETVNFSDPYFLSQQSLTVNNDC